METKNKLANVYSFTRTYTLDDNNKIVYSDTRLFSYKNKRFYKTNKTVEDLPEYYCDVKRYLGNYDVINSRDVKDLKYSWIKENHFMKDSVLRISFTDNIIHDYEKVNIDGKVYTNKLVNYKNVDICVYGYDILKYLAYINRFSDYDISEIKSDFIKHCEWLKKNEPEYAPECDDFGQWFEEKINDNNIWRH